jgi:hypothetical protein
MEKEDKKCPAGTEAKKIVNEIISVVIPACAEDG